MCPLVAIRRSGLPSNPTSWSLILPRGWVCLLWNALAFTGATPAGQREWRWVAQQYGAGFFPHDFPDTRYLTKAKFGLPDDGMDWQLYPGHAEVAVV